MSPNLLGQVFTNASVDNIRPQPFVHNSNSFFPWHSISVVQHSSSTEEGQDTGQIILRES